MNVATMALVLVTSLAGCKDNSAVDQLFTPVNTNDQPPEEIEVEVEVPIELQITISYPDVDGKKVGYQGTMRGSCSPVGKVVEIRGGATGFSVCGASQTWEATVDFTGATVGAVDVEVYLLDDERESAPAQRQFNKDNADCDLEANRTSQYANMSTGDGGGNPWFICTSLQLDNVRLNQADNFVIKNDINLGGNPFTPLPEYTGQFDGNNFRIIGLTINQPSSYYAALFQYVSNGGSVSNLDVEGVNITGRGTVGVIAARTRNGAASFTNIRVIGSDNVVRAVTNPGVGGILGYAEGSTTNLSFSQIETTLDIDAPSRAGGVLGYTHASAGTVSFDEIVTDVGVQISSGYGGGVVGYLDQTANSLTNVVTHLDVTNSTSTGYIGGIAGRMDGGDIDTCDVNSVVNVVGSYIGGVVGQFTGTNLHNCDVVTTITHDTDLLNGSYIGGIVGYANDSSFDMMNTNARVNITSTGVGNSTYVGGLVGRAFGGQVSNSHAKGMTDNAKGLITVVTGDGATTGGSQFGGAFGRLEVAEGQTFTINNVTSKVDLNVTSYTQDVYTGGWAGNILTTDPAALAAVLNISNSWATGNVTTTNRRAGGFAGSVYAGRSGSTVSLSDSYATGDVVVTESGSRDVYYVGGLIGIASTRNAGGDAQAPTGGVSLARVYARGDVSAQGQNVGGLAGYYTIGRTSAGGGTANIQDLSYEGTITITPGVANNDNIGGLFGYLSAAVNCSINWDSSTPNANYANATLVGSGRSYVGGIAGQVYGEETANITLDDIRSNMNVVTTSNYAGGAFAYVRSRRNSVTNITDIQATGNVTGGGGYVGGFIGYLNAEVGGGLNDSEIDIDNVTVGVAGSPVTSTLSGSGSYVGGFIGRSIGYTSYNDITDADAYYNVTSLSGDYIGGFIGETRYYNTCDDCHAFGSVTSTDGIYVGGFTGGSDQQFNAISNSSARGDITANYTGSENRIYVGGFAGRSRNSPLTRVYASGDVTINITGAGTINEARVGGLVGDSYTTSTITESYATGNINIPTLVGNNTYVGGLVGVAASDIYRSFATGNVVGGQQAGGLVGNGANVIQDSFASGNVTGVRYVGGLVGYFNGGAGLIERTYATGSVNRQASSSFTADFGELSGRCAADDRAVDSYWHNTTSVVDAAILTPHTNCNAARGLASMLETDKDDLVNFDFTNATGTTDDDWAYTTAWQVPGSGSVYLHPLPKWFQILNP